MVRRFSVLVLCVLMLLCFTLTACRDTDVTTTDSTDSTATAQTTETTEQTAAATEETAKATETTAKPTEATAKATEATTETPKKGTATPLLYKASDQKGNVVWLFGSVHIGREDYYPLPAYVLDAFDGADSLAVEADMIAFEKDTNLQTQVMSCLQYRDGTTTQDHLPKDLYKSAVAVLRSLNVYSPTMELYCPIFWSELIDGYTSARAGANGDLGVDQHLLERAYAAKKEVLEIESVQFQYQMLADFSDELQALLLESSLYKCQNPIMVRAELETLLDLWASGDEDAFTAYLADEEGDMTEEEALLNKEYNDAMVVNRNRSMADYAENALRSGKEVFICVGAAHVVGDGAVADLLSQRGYTVERVTG